MVYFVRFFTNLKTYTYVVGLRMFEDAIFVFVSVTVFLIGTTKVKVRRTLF